LWRVRSSFRRIGMKKTVIGIIALVVLVILGLGYKLIFVNKAVKINVATSNTTSGLTFAKAGPITLPPVSGYKLDTVNLGDGPVPLITVPLDTWGGYAAMFAANGGLEPSKDSLFYKKGHFAVKLIHIEDPTEQLAGFAAGKWPIIWTQMDGMPLLYDTFKVDKRVAPKVLGLFDWSQGGDGILVRSDIKTGADLKGKIILTSSNSPYAFMLLWYLAQNNLTGNDVKVVWEGDGQKALKLFKEHSEISAWVTWTPFLSDCMDSKSPSYVPDTRLIISSKDANQVIADLYMVRADLLADKPQMMQDFVAAMMEGSQQIGTDTFNTMAKFYNSKDNPTTASDAKDMLNDVHIANFPENKMFFDVSNTTGAFKIFNLAQEYYKELGSMPADANYGPERVLVPSIIKNLDKTGEFASQKNMVADSFNKKAALDVTDLESQRVVLANNVQLFFEAQKIDFDVHSSRPEIVENMKLLSKVAEQTKFLATTIVMLKGYLDTTKEPEFKAKGMQIYIEAKADAKLVSKNRALFVKSVLVKQFGVDPDRIRTEGLGWENPISTTDPDKNRRVEVQFISLE
jgi:NitT/TauT family transport system substrate-binding protein